MYRLHGILIKNKQSITGQQNDNYDIITKVGKLMKKLTLVSQVKSTFIKLNCELIQLTGIISNSISFKLG